MLKKMGAKKGKELKKLMFGLNSMSRESGSGSPVDHFLGRNVKSLLPNAGNKMISLRREIEKRKQEQSRWMKRLGRGSCIAYNKGDQVRVQNQQTGQWSVKGTVTEVIEHDDSSSKTYQVSTEEGGTYLRNGRFIKLRLSKLKKKSRVSFALGA